MTINSPGPEVPSKERLEAAKQAFRNQVLENDVLFTLVRLGLDAEELDLRLPNFSLEPWRPTSNEQNKQLVGLVATRGVDVRPDTAPELSAGMKVFQYIPVAEINFDDKMLRPSSDIRPLGDNDALTVALEAYMAAYRTFFTEVRDLAIDIDPMKGTVELLEDLDGRNYGPTTSPA